MEQGEFCTFAPNQYKRVQKLYYCKTCNLTNKRAVCAVCAKKCHAGHDLEEMKEYEERWTCDCGLNAGPEPCKCMPDISKMKCTCETNPKGDIHSYFCINCRIHVCDVCAAACHKGHTLIDGTIEAGQQCECGNGFGPSPCTKMPAPPPRNCTYLENGPKFTKQKVYQCLRCALVKKCAICENCAKVCHAGHPTICIGEVENASCDCPLDLDFDCKFAKKLEQPMEVNCQTTTSSRYFKCGYCDTTVCEACATWCHAGHPELNLAEENQPHECSCPHCLLPRSLPLKPIEIIPGHCTFERTGEDFIHHAKVYRCITCGLVDDMGCCEECAKTCHAGHEIKEEIGPMRFYCDCGSGSCITACKLISMPEKHCTLERNSPAPMKQKGYHCLTCNLDGNLAICSDCAICCHAGHELEEIEQETCFTCSCSSSYGINIREEGCHGCCHGCCGGGCEDGGCCGGGCNNCHKKKPIINRCKFYSRISSQIYKCQNTESPSHQKVYKCNTCGIDNLCTHCVSLCHMNHEIAENGETDSLKCACNEKCRLPQMYPPEQLPHQPKRQCQYQYNNGLFGYQANHFKCHTCDMYPLCENCANTCHKDHTVEVIDDIDFIQCKCGQDKSKCMLASQE